MGKRDLDEQKALTLGYLDRDIAQVSMVDAGFISTTQFCFIVPCG